MQKRKNELYKLSIDMPSVIVPSSFLNSSEIMEEDVCEAGSLDSKYLGPQSEVCFKRSKSNSVLLSNLKCNKR